MNDHRLAASETHPSETSIMSGTQNNRMRGRASGRRRGRHLLLGIALLALIIAVPARPRRPSGCRHAHRGGDQAHGDGSLSRGEKPVGGDVLAQLPLARSVVAKLPQGANLPPDLRDRGRSLLFASLGTLETSAIPLPAALGLGRGTGPDRHRGRSGNRRPRRHRSGDDSSARAWHTGHVDL